MNMRSIIYILFKHKTSAFHVLSHCIENKLKSQRRLEMTGQPILINIPKNLHALQFCKISFLTLPFIKKRNYIFYEDLCSKWRLRFRSFFSPLYVKHSDLKMFTLLF